MKMKCKKCGHEWDYNGRNKHTVTCPDCRKINKIDKIE